MGEHERETRTVTVPVAAEEWRSLLDSVRSERVRVVVEEDGRTVGALISAADYRRLVEMDTARREFFDVIDEMQAAFKDVPTEEIEREVAKAIREIREEDRAGERPTSAA